jgi:exodeoxyribonuclease VII large subunit
MSPELPEFGVSDFVAVFNQTINYAYSSVIIIGEVSELRISRGRWVYFNLKDENSSVKFFGSAQMLTSPIEDGMVIKVRGAPNLHHQYGFSIQVQTIQLVGEGSIKRSANILQQKLEKEGLFALTRKRVLPYPPKRIGLIASKESAAYSDFVKVINARWSGLIVHHYDVQVQGDDAPNQIIAGINFINSMQSPVEGIVITRGGGSADDLQAFNSENLVRSIAVSRIPTMVAIGHERDISLAELAADVRASTPSNAAELLVPNKKTELIKTEQDYGRLVQHIKDAVNNSRVELRGNLKDINTMFRHIINQESQLLEVKKELLTGYNPRIILSKGYSLIRSNGKLVRSVHQVKTDYMLNIEFSDGSVNAQAK